MIRGFISDIELLLIDALQPINYNNNSISFIVPVIALIKVYLDVRRASNNFLKKYIKK